jgi:ABC-type multidrug transport system ATPase subunit
VSEPAVQTVTLFARDSLGVVIGLDLSLPSGTVGALIGGPADGTRALAHVLAGATRPGAGLVLVGGAPPYESAEARLRIGALLDDPQLPPVGSVRELFAVQRALRGEGADRDAWLEVTGVSSMLKAPVRSLDRRQARSVALALALAVPAPALVLLYEPLADVIHADARELRRMLAQRAQDGACVLVLSASCSDASALADDVATLQRGRIGRAIGAPDIDELAPGDALELRVWTDKPREVSAALATESCVQSVWFRMGEQAAPIVLQTTDLEAAARAVARVVAERGARLTALVPTAPGTSQVHEAALRGIARDGRLG